MTTKLEQAARQALEALESVIGYGIYQDANWSAEDFKKTEEAIAALQEALSVSEQKKEDQAEQEPMYISESCAERGCACHYSVEVDGEPVAVYSAPVRTKELTDEEIQNLRHKIDWTAEWTYVNFARAVIAADREKNK